jgi:O-antigen ligase
MVGLALTSALWSEAPLLTLKRGAVLGGTTLFGIYIASRFRPRELLLLLACLLGATAVASLARVYLDPGRGIASGVQAGDWVGVYDHKNALGLYMGLGTLVFVVLARDLRRGRSVAWLGACLCAFLVLRSRSVTGLIATTAVVLVFPLLTAMRHRSMGRIVVALGVVTILASGAIVLAASAETALGAIGRDPSLTGRIPLWGVLLEQLRARPWFGYGYGAFWTGWGEGPSEVVAQITGDWYPWHSHNGLLNLGLQLGAAGVLVFLVDFATAIRGGLSALRPPASGTGYWPIMLLVFLLVASVSETIFYKHDDLFTVLYVATVFQQAGAAVAGVRRLPRRGMARAPLLAANPASTPAVSRILRRRRDADVHAGDR